MTVKEHLELCSAEKKELEYKLEICEIKYRECKSDLETWKKRAFDTRDEANNLRRRWFFDFNTMRTRSRTE